jgi:hypothetical protein
VSGSDADLPPDKIINPVEHCLVFFPRRLPLKPHPPWYSQTQGILNGHNSTPGKLGDAGRGPTKIPRRYVAGSCYAKSYVRGPSPD